jgi:glycosyltransferase involved in cell wall biosynthesis
MKFTWLSNAFWWGSGYGVQTSLMLPRMKADGHDPALIAYCGLTGHSINMNGIEVFPQAAHPYGQDICWEHTKRYGTNIMFSLTDAWIMEPERIPSGYKWIAYYPVDSNPMPPQVRDRLRAAYKRIAMSKYGELKTLEEGMDCYYVPHAVDTKAYYPVDKQEAREQLKLPKDAYIIGTVAMNKGAYPSRKSFVEMISAFTLFKQKHTNAVYLLHTHSGDGVADNSIVHFRELCLQNGLEIGKDVIFTDPYFTFCGANTDFMRLLYSSMDVFMLVSMGEGFGIPIIEAQACGIPVIVGDWTAMSELCFSGQKVDIQDSTPFYTPQASYMYIPHVKAIERKMHLEYKNPSSKEKALAGALKYDADLVYKDYWKPVLKDIERGLK